MIEMKRATIKSLWNAITGQTLNCYEGHTIAIPLIFDLAWSPDGNIASACSGEAKYSSSWQQRMKQTSAHSSKVAIVEIDARHVHTLPNEEWITSEREFFLMQ